MMVKVSAAMRRKCRAFPSKVLTEHYNWFNEKYFEGKLPDLVVYWADLPGDIIGRTAFRSDRWIATRILVDRCYKVRRRLAIACVSTILHEMVHVKVGRGNCGLKRGPFFNEMRRLEKLGAFTEIWG